MTQIHSPSPTEHNPFTGRPINGTLLPTVSEAAAALRISRVWSEMPHCRLWQPSDWEFAADTAELLARAAEAGGGPVAFWKEIRVRERVWAQPSMRGCRSSCGMSHRRWMGRPHRSRGWTPTAICDQCAARRCRPVGQRHERDRTSEELGT